MVLSSYGSEITEHAPIEEQEAKVEALNTQYAKEVDKLAKEVRESFIDQNEEGRSYMPLTALSYMGDGTEHAFDRNNDGKVTRRELRKEGVGDRYAQKNRDVLRAVETILNDQIEDEFEKSDIRGINRLSFKSLLADILEGLLEEDSELSKIFKQLQEDSNKPGRQKRQARKAFREYFREQFIKTDENNRYPRYQHRGAGARRDMNKIFGILEKAMGTTDDETESPIMSALQGLADLGKAPGVNLIGASNDIVLLRREVVQTSITTEPDGEETESQEGSIDTVGESTEKTPQYLINESNIFQFLCDFDSDGVVDSTQVKKGERKPNRSRRDTGSVMGLQLYQNIAHQADLDNDNKITDGPRTAQLIQNILDGARVQTREGSQLRKAVDAYTEAESNKSPSGFTLESFVQFMRGDYEVDGKKLSAVGVRTVKSHLESIAQQTNTGDSDVFDVLVHKHDRMKRIKERFGFSYEIDNAKIENVLRDRINGIITTENTGYREDQLRYVRMTVADRTMQTLNIFGDSLFANLSNPSANLDSFANLVVGAVPGAKIDIKNSFYNPDGSRNEKEIYDAMNAYIEERVIPSITFGLGENGAGIGAGIRSEKLRNELAGKQVVSFNVGALLPFMGRSSEIGENARVGISFQIEDTKQGRRNGERTRNLNNESLMPTVRAGVVFGVGFELTQGQVGLNFGPVIERDFPAGIEQKAREFDLIMRTILDTDLKYSNTGPEGRAIDLSMNMSNKESFISSLKARILNSDSTNVKNNKDFLLDMADALGEKMEWAGIFEIHKGLLVEDKPKFLQYFFRQFIDGFHENAIKQNLYNQLSGQGAKITKVSLGAIIGSSITALALAPVTAGGSVAALAMGGMGSLRLSTFRNSWRDNAERTSRNYENIERYRGMELNPRFKDMQEGADYLSRNLNTLTPGVPRAVQIEANEDGTWTISSNTEGGNILDHINIYTDGTAPNGFKIEDGKLILGDAPFRVGKLVKKDRVEFHLMIGDGSEKMEQIKKDDTEGTYTEAVEGHKKSYELNETQSTEIVNNLNGIDTTQKNKIINQIVGQREGREFTIPEISNTTFNLTIDQETGATTLSYNYLNSSNFSFERANEFSESNNLLDTIGKKENARAIDDIFKGKSQAFLKAMADKNIDNASQALIKIIESYKISGELKTNLDSIKTRLSDTKISLQEKTLICNRIRQIMAFSASTASMLEGKSGKPNVERVFFRRHINQRNYYEKNLTTGSNFPAGLKKGGATYQELMKITKDRNTYTMSAEPNILGYTAFYDYKDASHRGINQPGETRIAMNGQQKAEVTVNATDKEATKTRFLKKLESNNTEFDMIKKNINAQLESAGSTYTISNISDLGKLLNGKLTVARTDGVNENLTFDTDFVFYLLGECLNESVGLRINKITVEKSASSTTQAESFYEVQANAGVYNNAYMLNAQQRDLTLGLMGTGGRRDRQSEPGRGARPDAETEPGRGATPGAQASTQRDATPGAQQ